MKVGIGIQDFAKIREEDVFYVDKTNFIKEWWENKDDTTLITRPRRFGKTMNLSMLTCFFSIKYAGRSDLFEGLSVWNDEEYRKLQGTYPVIFLSFASIKTGDIESIKTSIKLIIARMYNENQYLKERLSETEQAMFESVCAGMSDVVAENSINLLAEFMEKYYGKKVLILLDEYDTPMQEAWIAGNWDETVSFFRMFFNATFKTNPHLERGLITGITRISKESIFSDLNHLEVVTTTSNKYATCFGFTENEVFASLDTAGLSSEKQQIKQWYDGFTFGNYSEIYNPWSIIKFLSEQGKYDTYWADTSSNGLVSTLIQRGSADIKQTFEELLNGKCLETELDEQIIFNQLDKNESAIWSLLLATGYLRVERFMQVGVFQKKIYTLKLTNMEVMLMFAKMIAGWFQESGSSYNRFIKALLMGDVDSMNEFMNEIALQSFSSFDTAKNASKKDDPERFYHGFVLGMMVDLEGRFAVTSNKESGFGRYDIMLEPVNKMQDNAYIIEFKVHKPGREKSIEETAVNALAQIEEKAYETALAAKGFAPEKIRKYGFAFEGRKCLIKEG